jgi:hypothetical protein
MDQESEMAELREEPLPVRATAFQRRWKIEAKIGQVLALIFAVCSTD